MRIGGIHILLDFINCPARLLDSIEFLESILYKIAQFCDLQIHDITKHKYSPQGVSMVALISESHMSIHTWPEKNFCCIDIFSCKDEGIEPISLKDCVEKLIEGEGKVLCIERIPKQMQIKTNNADSCDLRI